MRAEFRKAGEPDRVVGAATWDGRRAVIEADDDSVRASIQRVFRPSPISVDDSSYRARGTSGPAVVEPGDLDWFRAAVQGRASAEGLEGRLASTHPGGWDPAMDPQTYGWAGRKISLSGER